MSEYFTQEHFSLLQALQGQKHDPTNPAHEAGYQRLRQAYEVTLDWAKRVKGAMFPDGRVKIRRRPTNQGNNFASYNWAKIYPTADSPASLAYTVGLNGNEGFVVKIDTVKLQDGEAARDAYVALRGPSHASPIMAVLPINKGLSMSMDELTAWSVEAIRQFELGYEEVAQRIGLVGEVELDEVLNHFDVNEGFRAMRSGWSAAQTSQFCRLARLVHFSGMDWWFAGTRPHLRFGRKNAGSARAVAVIGLVRGSRSCQVTWRPELESISPFVRQHITEEIVDRIEAALDADDELLQDLIRTDEERDGLWPEQAGDDVSTATLNATDSREESDSQPVKQDAITAELAFNRIYFGPPGTGKTYGLTDLLREEFTADEDEPSAVEGTTNRYSFVTFHQSYGYEEFVEGLRPVIRHVGEQGSIRYEIRPGVFRALCERASRFPEEKFAIVIDEINRGNISKIFGELITLIELDKRTGLEGCHPVVLPYSQECFSVPRNVSIIGTMNTADRSLALLDTALRRRFEFVEVLPNSEDEGQAPLAGLRVNTDGVCIHVPKLLSAINQRIEALYDRDHLIGHAYFTPLQNAPDGIERMAALTDIFDTRILPLLEEYFFEDWQKIRLVLGDNQKPLDLQFVREITGGEESLARLFGFNASRDGYGVRARYNRNTKALRSAAAYVGIYGSMLGSE
ncbi:McrB family protein [Xanthomonas campestris]|uniref:McrB family protein n=1 Tax=Xanthomonas campestris TaxID=339 RepID=UPI000E0F5DF1|nr:AAA family ATPase [Xanthomonas campestris]